MYHVPMLDCHYALFYFTMPIAVRQHNPHSQSTTSGNTYSSHILTAARQIKGEKCPSHKNMVLASRLSEGFWTPLWVVFRAHCLHQFACNSVEGDSVIWTKFLNSRTIWRTRFHFLARTLPEKYLMLEPVGVLVQSTEVHYIHGVRNTTDLLLQPSYSHLHACAQHTRQWSGFSVATCFGVSWAHALYTDAVPKINPCTN